MSQLKSRKPRKKHMTAPGPFSRDNTLATIDRRTRAGRVMRAVESDLVAHLAGTPSAAERLIIQSAALKATRLSLLADKLLEGGEISQGSDHHALAWMNALRHDLQAIGLQSRARDITASNPLAEHFSRPPVREAAP